MATWGVEVTRAGEVGASHARDSDIAQAWDRIGVAPAGPEGV